MRVAVLLCALTYCGVRCCQAQVGVQRQARIAHHTHHGHTHCRRIPSRKRPGALSRAGELFAAPLVVWLEDSDLAGMQQGERVQPQVGGWKEYVVEAPGALQSAVEQALRCAALVGAS